MIDPQNAYSQLARKVVVPVVGLAILFLIGLLAALWLVAGYQTRTAQGEQALLARSALAVRGDEIRKVVLDYALWDEAFENLVHTPNAEWADLNIGLWSYQQRAIDVTQVIAPDGGITYETIRGARLGRAFDLSLSRGIETLIQRAREDGGNAAASGFVMSQSGPALVAASVIRPSVPGPSDPKTQHLLLFVDILDYTTLDAFGRMYHLQNLHLEPPTYADPAAVPVEGVDGTRLAMLAWTGVRPGDALLQAAVPVWAAVALTFALLLYVADRQARNSARLLAMSEHRASHDNLTGLPNRLHLFERLDTASRRVTEGGPKFALAYLDLDGFKRINDTKGHEAGDEVLQLAARRMRRLVGDDDVIARLGGDEFVMILGLGTRDFGEIRRLLKAMIEALERPIVLRGGVEVEISATIGVSMAPGDGTDPLTLLRKADEALYAGKRSGKRRATFHAGPVVEMDEAA